MESRRSHEERRLFKRQILMRLLRDTSASFRQMFQQSLPSSPATEHRYQTTEMEIHNMEPPCIQFDGLRLQDGPSRFDDVSLSFSQDNQEEASGVYTEEYDSDWENPRWFDNVQYVHREQHNRSVIEISDSEPEEPGPFNQPSQTGSPVFSSFEVYDPDFEDPRLFNFLDDAPAVTSLPRSINEPRSQTFDPDFEDPRLFNIFETDTPAVSSSPQAVNVASRHELNEETAEKHMWPCVVCVTKPPETLFTPCFHSVCCRECADQVKNRGGCPVCSTTIDLVERIFFTQKTCVVCMDNPPQTVLKPCCHAVCCEECTATILNENEEVNIECKCPVCKADIEETDIFRLAYT